MKFSVNILVKILVLTSLFPYSSFIDLGSDTSFWPILICTIICFKLLYYKFSIISNFYFKSIILFSLSFFLISLIIGFYYLDPIILRYALSFWCIIISFLVVYKFFNDIISYYLKFIPIVTWIWFLIILIESFSKFFGFNFFEIVIDLFGSNSSRSSYQRGLTGLAPEPSYLGLFSMLNFIFISSCENIFLIKLRYKALWLIMFVSSLSITPFIIFFISFAFWILFNDNFKKKILILLCSVPLSIFVFLFILSLEYDLRLIHILSNILNNPFFLLEDLSSASRISSFLIGPLTLISEFWLFGCIWYDYTFISQNIFSSYFNHDISFLLSEGISTSNKIKSSLGSILYLFGIWGFFFNFIFIRFFFKNYYFINGYNQLAIWIIISSFFVQVPFTTLFYLIIFFSLKFREITLNNYKNILN